MANDGEIMDAATISSVAWQSEFELHNTGDQAVIWLDITDFIQYCHGEHVTFTGIQRVTTNLFDKRGVSAKLAHAASIRPRDNDDFDGLRHLRYAEDRIRQL